jgi:hypothetical protein
MTSTQEQPKKELRALRSKINTELRKLVRPRGGSYAGHFVHTIQIVTTERPVRSGGVSHTLSYQADVYQSLVRSFVELEGRSYQRTLLGEDFVEGPFWYADLGSGSIIDPGASRKDDFHPLEALFHQSASKRQSQRELLDAWQIHLQRGFNNRGSTMLVTQAYEDQPLRGELHIAAVFILFNRSLQQDLGLSDAEITSALYPVARLARDFVVKRIFRLGRESIERRVSIIEGAVKKLLCEPDRSHALSEAVLKTLGRFSRVITSQYPMLISGETGTGNSALQEKFTAAGRQFWRRPRLMTVPDPSLL